MSATRLYTVTFWPEGMGPVEIDVRAQDEDEALGLARTASGLRGCDASIAEASS